MSLALIAVPIGLAAVVPSWALGGSAAGLPVTLSIVVLVALAWRSCAGGTAPGDTSSATTTSSCVTDCCSDRSRVVPYGRMQFIDVSAGPIDRNFGLATVQLHTAAAASDARIPGLAQAEADRLRDRLASLGEAQATGL